MIKIHNDQNTYSIKFEHRKTYLYASKLGKQINSETCKESWKQILNESQKNQYQKILVEIEDVGDIGTIPEIREMIIELSDLIDDKSIAIINTQAQNFKTIRFAEMSATNLGLQVKFYTSVGEAKEWLLLQE